MDYPGAPEDGVVADEKLLDKIDRYTPKVFTSLSKPSNGSTSLRTIRSLTQL